MQENNFERQVHSIMRDFKVTPSDNVWEKLEADFNYKRKGRYFLLPSILCVCFLMGSFFLNDLRSPKNNFTGLASVNIQPSGADSVDEIVNEEKANNKTIAYNKTQTSKEQKDNVVKKHNYSTHVNTLANTTNEKVTNDLSYIKQQSSNTKTNEFAIDQQDVGAVNNNYDRSPDDPGGYFPGRIFTYDIEKINSKTNLLFLPLNTEAIKNNGQKTLALNTTDFKKTNSQLPKKKWRLQMSVTAGSFAASTNSILNSVFSNDANKSSTLEVAYYQASAGQLDSTVYAQSYLKKGNTFSIGLNFLRPLTSRTSLSVGAGFRYASTNVTSSSYRPVFDQALNAVRNQSITDLKYKNDFYFIDIPIQVQSLIGKGKRLPIYWNAGVVYSRIIKSNTPQFSLEQNSYLNNNSTLANNVFGISGGLDIELFTGKKSSFKIGPSLYYSLSNVADKNIYANTRFHFAGISLKKMF